MVAVNRRAFLARGSSGAVLSVAAVGLLAGQPTIARAKSGDAAKDVGILNVALGPEHEAINAYQLGAMSGLLQKPVLDVAVLFQSHHKAHRDALVATIQKLGGNAVAEKSLDEYAKSLNASALKSQADVLVLAAKLELGATNAYLGVIPAFADRGLAQISARLAADETAHWTQLNAALGRPFPSGALSFGA
jgi:Ferritin-like domain